LTFFVDANVLVYAAVPGERREACIGLLAAIATGSAAGRTSAAVLEEVWHIELSGRIGVVEGLAERGFVLMRPLVPITDEAFESALSLNAPRLGANDRLHAATCLTHGIETIVSADEDFDRVAGLLRVDPIDGSAMDELRA
jgi:predicted nucleic acid-binding protein